MQQCTSVVVVFATKIQMVQRPTNFNFCLLIVIAVVCQLVIHEERRERCQLQLLYTWASGCFRHQIWFNDLQMTCFCFPYGMSMCVCKVQLCY